MTLMYTLSVQSFIPLLEDLTAILDKAVREARGARVDPSKLVNGKLAPDMYPLAKQVLIACDHAGQGAAKLIGQQRLRPQDEERNLDDLIRLISDTLDYLRTLKPGDFAGAENRVIKVPLMHDNVLKLTGVEFLKDWALPNFYFHVVTAYGILRHHGVEIGKRDYLARIGRMMQAQLGGKG